MKLKQMLTKILGKERLSNYKGILCHYICKINQFINRTPSLRVYNKDIKVKYILTNSNYHVFRGYYDIEYLSEDKNKFLCHRLSIRAKDNQNTKCEIGFYDLQNGDFNKITETQTWCWQQGSRLRWHPIRKDCILDNSIENNKYCMKVYNILTKSCIDIINRPIYDLTKDYKYGISINFSRLQRLRPGYGYNYLKDETEKNNAPENDGIFIVNLENKESRLLYSLNFLAQKIDTEKKFIHYINHISIAPNGKNFIFFHIYVNPDKKGWKTLLYVSDIQGENLKCLEKEDRVSHYCWIDSEKIMVTCMQEDGNHYYCIYNIINGEKKIIMKKYLSNDGHPGKLTDDKFITDTYPLKYSTQQLLKFSINNEKLDTLAYIYHDYRLRGEKRCDLHPVISNCGRYISVDSTFKNKRRSIIIFEVKEGVANE